MRILVVGATGTIGREIVKALSNGNEIIPVTRSSNGIKVDLRDRSSIERMFKAAGKLDAVISAAGNARFKPLDRLEDEDFQYSLENKLMGQANLVRLGLDALNDGGSVTLTSGDLATSPMKGSGAISMVNAGLEGFTRAAALEAPRGIRVNVVSPPWVAETLTAMKMDPSHGLPSAAVARAYVESVTGTMTGEVIHLSA